VQNRIGYKWTLDRINRRADRVMKDAFDRVFETSQKYKVPMRLAAYMVAIEKVASTYTFRGGY
jgi:glutamate dehydrogenase (NAD(P)+)